MAQRTNDELETEIQVLNNKLDRYEVAHGKGGERERDQITKISKLKDVARFYRAQRDRVDAYLSCMIDAVELQSRPMLNTDVHPVETMAIPEPPTPAYGRRPSIQEPFEPKADGIHGRGYVRYRDQEPETTWEDF